MKIFYVCVLVFSKPNPPYFLIKSTDLLNKTVPQEYFSILVPLCV